VVLFSATLSFMVVRSSLAKTLAKSPKTAFVSSEDPEESSSPHQDVVYVYASQLVQKQVGYLDHHGR
jgi:hypothetical protein